jgi:hypothetical protein
MRPNLAGAWNGGADASSGGVLQFDPNNIDTQSLTY